MHGLDDIVEDWSPDKKSFNNISGSSEFPLLIDSEDEAVPAQSEPNSSLVGSLTWSTDAIKHYDLSDVPAGNPVLVNQPPSRVDTAESEDGSTWQPSYAPGATRDSSEACGPMRTISTPLRKKLPKTTAPKSVACPSKTVKTRLRLIVNTKANPIELCGRKPHREASNSSTESFALISSCPSEHVTAAGMSPTSKPSTRAQRAPLGKSNKTKRLRLTIRVGRKSNPPAGHRSSPQEGKQWSMKEDCKLLQLRDVSDLDWEQIAKYFPGRTASSIASRYAEARTRFGDEDELA